MRTTSICIILMLIFAMLLSGCGHQHEMAEKVIKEKTCTENGEIEHYCTTCNYKWKEEIKAEHTYEKEIISQSTCTTKGKVKFICKNCGDNYKEEIPLLSHKYENKYCTICGAKKICKIFTGSTYGTYDYGAYGTIRTTCKITKVDAEISSYGVMTIYFSGIKTYDVNGETINGPCSFMLIIKDSYDNIVYSEQIMTHCVANQTFKIKTTPNIFFDESEDYHIELSDYMM